MLGVALAVFLAQATTTFSGPVGVIQGIVVKAGANESLSKTTLELRGDNDPVPAASGPPGFPALATKPLSNTTSEADGRFLFRNVRPGRYRIVATRPGYVRRLTSVSVTGGSTSDVQIALTATAAISGRVSSSTGEPIGNVAVEALTASYDSGRRLLSSVQLVRTDDRGEYRLFWLPPGRYFVRATHPDTAVGVMGMMLGLGPAARFGNTGFGFGGPGPAGVFATRATGDSGLFDAFGGPSGVDPSAEQYVPIYFPAALDEQGASPVDLREGTDAGGIDIPVSSVRPRHVRGFVVDGTTGQVAQYAGLRLVTDESSSLGPGGGLSGVPGAGLSNDGRNPIDPDGSFDVTLLPGRHTLAGTAGTGVGYVTVEVLESDLDNVRIVAMPQFDLAGRITADGEISNADLSQLRISLARELPVVTRPSSYSVPRADGTFVVSATSGDYRVNVAPFLTASPTPGGSLNLPKSLEAAYLKSLRLGNVDVLNRGVRLEGRPEAALDIVIGTRPGAIQGAVADAPAGVMVALVPDVRTRFDLWKTAATDPSGQFQMSRVPPGNYKLFAWDGVSERAWQDPDFLRLYEDRGTSATVREGATEIVRLITLPNP
jgi:protocatechuate 3,4-dioxygenase beta subunit